MQLRDRTKELIGSATRAIRAGGRAVMVASYRMVAAIGIVSSAVLMTGCYTYPVRPLTEVAPPAVVSAEISDIGRIALAEPLGTGVARVDGKVVQNDSALRLMITQVQFMNGIASKWQGQELRLRPQDVRTISQRTFSRQRTAVFSVLGVLAAAAALTAGFTGFFSGDPSNDKGGEPPPTT